MPSHGTYTAPDDGDTDTDTDIHTSAPTGTGSDAELTRRLGSLQQGLASLGSVVVAFSGGADSAFLLAAAVRALGPARVLAATGDSASLAARERTAVARVAAELGVRHAFVPTGELAVPGYRQNAPSRCWFCKSELLAELTRFAAEHGFAHVATGTNADDVVDRFRPGIKAAAARGAVTPLSDAGLTKRQIRRASRDWGLSTWDKPASPCLSSRIAYGLTVSRERLARVEAAEEALRDALREGGITTYDLRVRDLGDRASVQVDRRAVPAVARCGAALDAVRRAGFATVEVDPLGFRSGSLNTLARETQGG